MNLSYEFITYHITLLREEGLLSYSHLRSSLDPSTTVMLDGSTLTVGGSGNID
jgi:hypothetical protein